MFRYCVYTYKYKTFYIFFNIVAIFSRSVLSNDAK